MAQSQDIFVNDAAPVLVFKGAGLVHILLAPGYSAPNNGPVFIGGPDVTPATGLPLTGAPYRIESEDKVYAIALAGYDGHVRVFSAR